MVKTANGNARGEGGTHNDVGKQRDYDLNNGKVTACLSRLPPGECP